MKAKKLIILPAVLLVNFSFAQSGREVASAELAFANTAKTKSTKTAFLQYMDSTAVVFDKGNIYNGIQHWNKQEETSGKLLWHPSFFAMSVSGDLGFTTGPWEYRASMQDSVTGSGQYTTIWIKNKNEGWKFLVDMGVYYKPSLFHQQSQQEFNTLIPSKEPVDILSVEQKFIREFEGNGPAAYKGLLTENSWLNIDRKQPLQTATAVLSALAALPAKMAFTPVAGGMSAARDMAYVYGTIQYEGKKENYLRIWVNTATGWKILLQVIKN